MPGKKNAVLIILDGWGIGRNDELNPIYAAKPETFDWLRKNYPVTSLTASGISVGLAWEEVGSSEAGHVTLGAGKVLYQYYPKISMAIRDGSFFANKTLKDACAHARGTNGTVHFAGLLTKAGFHASLEHLLALIKFAENENVPRISLHLFGDGKDSPARSITGFLKEIPEQYLGSLVGRYYAMDQNGNWQLTETAYQALMGNAPPAGSPEEAVEKAFARGLTEEYLPASCFGEHKGIADGDALVFFNFRADAMRQLAAAFLEKDFDKFPVAALDRLFVATMTHYDNAFEAPIVCPADTAENTLGKVMSDCGGVQLRIAESYKYAHVTSFFNGYHEEPYPGEYRTIIPSAATLHPEEHPEMMSAAITDRLVEAIEGRAFDLIVANYACPDVIAHTGNYDATVTAIRAVDKEIARVLAVAQNPDTILMITSDHGNAEMFFNPATGALAAHHNTNPVPFYLVADGFKGKKFVNTDSLEIETLGTLADVAPTLLGLMGIPKPEEMTGQNLLDGLV